MEKTPYYNIVPRNKLVEEVLVELDKLLDMAHDIAKLILLEVKRMNKRKLREGGG